MAEDTNGQVGAMEDEDAEEVRRPMHLKRGDPRAAEIEGKPKFKAPNPDEVRPETASARSRAAKRSK